MATLSQNKGCFYPEQIFSDLLLVVKKSFFNSQRFLIFLKYNFSYILNRCKYQILKSRYFTESIIYFLFIYLQPYLLAMQLRLIHKLLLPRQITSALILGN